ncbi:hypothetical protein J4H86_04335 [Spiractinospora alimapuensis]|uniref:NAD(P)-dependent oxidoreductase n=1 Tax=Spiractinospora alimapuensis TaxID=2820884 RepID=UPI001F195CC4|nr:NAD(P)-dependent oxidoreductase [Spiractinospora alimapuensis]QVQ53040.1 hypothetical protein J4H86_04335 [Spiractinospora alimapuensis]
MTAGGVPGLVYVDDPVHPDAVDHLRRHGPVALGYGPDATPFDAVCANVTGVLVRTGTFDATRIDAAPHLRVIARHGVGTDAIDVRTAAERGVLVLVTPEANSASVAEHTIGLLVAAARRFPQASHAVRSGRFLERDGLAGLELADSTLAVIGLGRVGRRVATIAQAMGMNVRGHDMPEAATTTPPGVTRAATLTDALRGAHALTLHVPLTEHTRGLIGPTELDLLANGAVVVNAARGGVLEEPALVERLRAGRIGGAGLDVYAVEPPPDDSLLLDLDTVVLTPHTAAHTAAALRRMSLHAAHGITAVLDDRPLDPTAAPVRPD